MKQIEAEAGSSSVTRDFRHHDINCGDNPFSVIKTPGNNSKQEAYKHAVLLLRAALKLKKVNLLMKLKKSKRMRNLLKYK